MTERTLSTTRDSEAPSTLKTAGNVNRWQLLSKAWNEAEGWMKTTQAIEVRGAGCLVKTSTYYREGNTTSEALAWLPAVTLEQLR